SLADATEELVQHLERSTHDPFPVLLRRFNGLSGLDLRGRVAAVLVRSTGFSLQEDPTIQGQPLDRLAREFAARFGQPLPTFALEPHQPLPPWAQASPRAGPRTSWGGAQKGAVQAGPSRPARHAALRLADLQSPPPAGPR